MVGTSVARQSPVILVLRENQVKETGADDMVEEVIPEEVVTKDVADEVDKVEYSNSPNTHHQSGTLNYKWKILARY